MAFSWQSQNAYLAKHGNVADNHIIFFPIVSTLQRSQLWRRGNCLRQRTWSTCVPHRDHFRHNFIVSCRIWSANNQESRNSFARESAHQGISLMALKVFMAKWTIACGILNLKTFIFSEWSAWRSLLPTRPRLETAIIHQANFHFKSWWNLSSIESQLLHCRFIVCSLYVVGCRFNITLSDDKVL